MDEILYSKYSNERSRSFAFRTDILEGKAGYYVEKKALYPEGKAHVDEIYRWYEKLTGIYQEIGFACNRCEKTEDGVRLEYLEGQTLEEFLDGLLEKGCVEEAKERLMSYLEQVRTLYDKELFQVTEHFEKVFGREKAPEGMTCAEITNIDMVCENVVLTAPPTVLDYEWTFDFPVPCQFVLYRIIHYYIATHSAREILSEEAFCEAFCITREMREYFDRMESHFQEYLTQGHIPMREMFASMTPGVGNEQMVTGEQLQIFFMTDGGYQPENSVSYPIMDNHVSCTVKLPEGCPMLRIDPGDHPCAVYLEKVLFDGQKASLKDAVVPEGVITGKWAYLVKSDPNIVNLPVPEGAKEFQVSLRVYPGTKELVAAACDTGKENKVLRARISKVPKAVWNMRNTKVWKLYKKCRSKAERK